MNESTHTKSEGNLFQEIIYLEDRISNFYGAGQPIQAVQDTIRATGARDLEGGLTKDLRQSSTIESTIDY